MLAWGREVGEEPLTVAEHKALEEALDGHSWASPSLGIYVIGLTYGTEERRDLVDKIKNKRAEKKIDPIALLISPPIDTGAGLYIGIAKKDLWGEINRRAGHFELAEGAKNEVPDSESADERS